MQPGYSSGAAVYLRRLGPDFLFGYGIYDRTAPGAAQLYDCVLAFGCAFLRELTRGEVAPLEILFCHRQPDDTEPYRRVLKAPLRFNETEAGIVIPGRSIDCLLNHRAKGGKPRRGLSAPFAGCAADFRGSASSSSDQAPASGRRSLDGRRCAPSGPGAPYPAPPPCRGGNDLLRDPRRGPSCGGVRASRSHRPPHERHQRVTPVLKPVGLRPSFPALERHDAKLLAAHLGASVCFWTCG